MAWLDHNARTLFSVQDANGDFRPLFVQADCSSYASLLQFNPLATALLNSTIQSLCKLH